MDRSQSRPMNNGTVGTCEGFNDETILLLETSRSGLIHSFKTIIRSESALAAVNIGHSHAKQNKC